MRHYHTKLDQFTRVGGFTDVVAVYNTDLTQAVNNTVQTVNLTTLALALGDIVSPEIIMEVITPSVGLTTCTCSVGVTGALTQFIAAQDMVAGNKYFVPANTVGAYADIAAAKFLTATFTPGAAEALSACTALEVRFWFKISRKADRDIQL